MIYALAYFVSNIILTLYILYNVFIKEHTEKERNELKEELGMYLAFSLLFGVPFIVYEYSVKEENK